MNPFVNFIRDTVLVYIFLMFVAWPENLGKQASLVYKAFQLAVAP